MEDERTVVSSREDSAAERRGGLRSRLPGARRARPAALGIPEAVALSVAALLLVAAVASYVLLLRPQRTRLSQSEASIARLQARLAEARAGAMETQDTQASVGRILDSLNSFEVEHLGSGANGGTQVIEELNRLIRKNNLRISGGISFTQLEETVPGASPQPGRQQQSGGQARAVQSVFPGIGITMTVEGTYPALRNFVRDVEADRQFIVINTVELEGVTESGSGAQQASADGTPVAQRARGTLVSLRLEMAVYFRRAGTGLDQPAAGSQAR